MPNLTKTKCVNLIMCRFPANEPTDTFWVSMDCLSPTDKHLIGGFWVLASGGSLGTQGTLEGNSKF